MPDFDYSIIDGDATTRKVRGEDLGTDGTGIQIIGHKFISDDIGRVADVAAADETASAGLVALVKGVLRETIAIATGGGAAFVEGDIAAVTIATTATTLATIDCRGYKRLGLTVQNTGGTALSSFETKVRYNSGFAFHFPELSTGYDAASANTTGNATALVRKTNGTDPVTLAAAAYTWIRFNVEAVESIEFTATVAAGTTDLDAWWVVER
jgi:hypothetical protein